MKKLNFDRRAVIQELLDRFWVVRKSEPELFFQISDMQSELRHFFSDTFRYGLIVTHELVKLEKTPTALSEWLGSKKGPDFSSNRDFVFLFLLLAFLEAKNNDQQFLMQDICDYFSASYPGEQSITWKQSTGYRNRLSLIRVLKYAVKMNLLVVNDQDIDDFRINDEHDVLLQKTSYLPYFLRPFSFDIRQWTNINDIGRHLTDTAREGLERRHSVFRKLFMEPILYLDELPEEEALYIKNYGRTIEEHVEKHTFYNVERYSNAILLVKHENQIRETLYPSEDIMMHKFTLSFCGRVRADLEIGTLLEGFDRSVDIPLLNVDQIIDQMREEESTNWSRTFEELPSSELRSLLIQFLTQWKFGYQLNDLTLKLREGAFRVTGAFEI